MSTRLLHRSPSCLALLQLQGATWGEAVTPSAAEEARRLFTAGSGGSSGGSSGSSGGSRGADLQAAASRLLLHSREQSQNLGKSSHFTDGALQKRMDDLLQLGFSGQAIQAAIKRDGGGPYLAEAALRETVDVLRAAGFSQKQLDTLLSSSHAFSRSTADIAANLAWLRQQFGLTEQQVAKVCAKSNTLLHYMLDTLQHNWSEVERTCEPTRAAMSRLPYALRQGKAHFLRRPPDTVRCGSRTGLSKESCFLSLGLIELNRLVHVVLQAESGGAAEAAGPQRCAGFQAFWGAGAALLR